MKLPDYIVLTFIVFMLLANLGISFSQSGHQIDSLESVIYAQENDTMKVLQLFELSDQVYDVNPEKALVYQKLAYHISKQLNYIKGMAKARYEQSYLYKSMGNLDSAIYFTLDYIAIGDSLNDTSRIASGYLQYGNLIRRKGKTEEAQKYYFKCLQVFEKLGDTIGMISSYNGIGITYKLTTNFDSAAFYYLKTMRLCDEIGFDRGMGSSLINLGKIYIELDDYESAKKYTHQSIEYNIKTNNQWNVALGYTNLGMIAVEQGQFDLGLEYYNKALEIQKQIGNKIGLNNLLINIGNIYKEQKKYSKALKNYNLAIRAFIEIEYKTGLISALMNKADVNAKLGNLNQALALYDSCLKLTIETGEKEKRRTIYMSIYQTYQNAGNFQKAFEYLYKFQLLNDSIYNLEREEVIANLTLKYEKEKDQAKILALENDYLEKDLDLRQRTNQRNIYLASGSGLILIISFFFIFYHHKSQKDKIIAEQKIQQLEEEKKLLAASSIVDGQEEERKRIAKELHDGLGVLLSTVKMQFTTIKDISTENKPIIDKAEKLLEQAAGDVRKISHNMMPGLLTKLGFFEAVEDLIEQVDEMEELNAICDILGDTKRLPKNTEIMLYRIIQEMVNNTLKHAEAKNIRLNMKILAEQLELSYSDDGKGFIVEEKQDLKSIGLSSIQSRVNFLNGKSTVVSAPGIGTTYFIKTPI